ncbi:MAG TPA: ABC transporter permease [Pseudonocardiaceae bacterium]|nr:ABC transporter permease [Pseudonocardiaceae bacterium]
MTDPHPAAHTVRLVAGREFGCRAGSRRLVLTTVTVAVLLVAFVVLQAYVFGHERTLRVGLAGQAISLQQALPQEMVALGVPVDVRQVDTVAEGVADVRNGRLDVLVSGARSALRVTIDNQLDPRLRATLNSLVRQQILDAQLAQLGARPNDVLAKVDQAQITVTQLNATDPNLGQRKTLGIVTALLVAWSLAVGSVLAGRRVVADAAGGTAEVLLPVLRPRRLLTGNLTGIGLTVLVHAAGLGVVGVAAALATGAATVPAAVAIALGAGLLGFVLGFALYGTAAAAVTALRPGYRGAVLVLLAAVFLVSAVLIGVSPDGRATAVLAVLPPFAPVLVPARLAVGVGTGWQVLLAVALALATVGALAWFAGRVYPRSLFRA